MENLKVLTGRIEQVDKEPKYMKYTRAITRFAKNYSENSLATDRELLKKFIYLEIKSLSLEKRAATNIEESKQLFGLYSMTTNLLALLTPKEFMQMFPIEKEYNGKKYQSKDYFSTMEEINKLDINQPIGEEKIMYFLWDYHNWEIAKFEVNKMCAMSTLRKYQGQKGLMEEFCEQNNISTYTHYKEQGIMIENGTGKCVKVNQAKKRKPKYLKAL